MAITLTSSVIERRLFVVCSCYLIVLCVCFAHGDVKHNLAIVKSKTKNTTLS